MTVVLESRHSGTTVFSWTRQMEARPTEYDGIVYRSKCEAMFARALDLKRDFCNAFTYEPEWGGGKTDFATMKLTGKFCDNGYPLSCTEVRCIQYKPARPTFTYANEFRKEWSDRRLLELRRLLMENGAVSGLVLIYPEIIWGSVYSTDRGRVWIDKGVCRFESMDWLASVEQEVRTYRYDLQNSRTEKAGA